MLVLSRHKDEIIRIGDNIVITIVEIRGDKVRVGIEAPKDIPVHREEVYLAIQKASSKGPDSEGEDTPTGNPTKLRANSVGRNRKSKHRHGGNK